MITFLTMTIAGGDDVYISGGTTEVPMVTYHMDYDTHKYMSYNDVPYLSTQMLKNSLAVNAQ